MNLCLGRGTRRPWHDSSYFIFRDSAALIGFSGEMGFTLMDGAGGTSQILYDRPDEFSYFGIVMLVGCA